MYTVSYFLCCLLNSRLLRAKIKSQIRQVNLRQDNMEISFLIHLEGVNIIAIVTLKG